MNAQPQQINVEELTFKDIMEAYAALEPLEKMMIDRLADTLEIRVNQMLEESGSPSQGKAVFNRTGALEVLAKLGIWMVSSPQPFRVPADWVAFTTPAMNFGKE